MKTARGPRGMPPRNILKSIVSEMPFPAFWGKNLGGGGKKRKLPSSSYTPVPPASYGQRTTTGLLTLLCCLVSAGQGCKLRHLIGDEC